MKYFLVGLGGAIGSITRYGVVSLFPRLVGGGFPWGTFSVNLMGSFAIGFIARFFYLDFPQHQLVWLFVVVGFLGGFTTFSAFSFDSLILLQKQSYILFFGNVCLHIFGCLLAVIVGHSLSKLIIS